jgi:hypothetical protein
MILVDSIAMQGVCAQNDLVQRWYAPRVGYVTLNVILGLSLFTAVELNQLG